MSNSTPEIVSPLTTEKTDSIGELFDRDPLTWTDDEVDAMIAKLRETRKDLDVNQAPKAKAKVTAEKKAKVEAMSVDDLFKELKI